VKIAQFPIRKIASCQNKSIFALCKSPKKTYLTAHQKQYVKSYLENFPGLFAYSCFVYYILLAGGANTM